jgi:hypothetical protein
LINFDIDARCGRHLRFRDLVYAGETWRRTQAPNLPEQAGTIEAMLCLTEQILDPVIDEFGPIEITYCLGSRGLTKLIPGHIDPSRDQHAGHEQKRNGQPICRRFGQAVDFRVDGICSGKIAAWIARHLHFDRIYFYGSDRPLHVSAGPEEKRAVVTMFLGPSGRRVPRPRKVDWLFEQFGA